MKTAFQVGTVFGKGNIRRFLWTDSVLPTKTAKYAAVFYFATLASILPLMDVKAILKWF